MNPLSRSVPGVPSALSLRAARVEGALRRLLGPGARNRLEEAMAWSLLAGGKRLRPVLALATAGALGAAEEAVLLPACALECLHTYSLIHDDLPSMDDDDLRRGRPTCHVRFGEATAILAGDALQSLAFQVLLTWPEGEEWNERKLRAAAIVARAAGREGMVLGQHLDLEAEAGPAGKDGGLVERIHLTKTAALLEASVLVGGVLAGAGQARLQRLAAFGRTLGLAFQIVDDLLDVEGRREELGKEPGGDAESGKATAPAAWGIEGARRRAARHESEAQEELDRLGGEGVYVEDLRELLRFVLARRG